MKNKTVAFATHNYDYGLHTNDYALSLISAKKAKGMQDVKMKHKYLPGSQL